VRKTANVLEKLPKAMQPKVKEALHNIWQAEPGNRLMKHLNTVLNGSARNIRKRWNRLAKDKASTLAFYDYPAKNWQHIRTTNPVESVFATVRLRTTKTKNC